MGATTSNAISVSNITKEALTNVIQKSSQDCKSISNNNQTMRFTNFTCGGNLDISNLNQKIEVTQNFSCAQQSQQNSELQTKLKEEIKNNLESTAKGQAIGQIDSNSIAMTDSVNNIVNNINMTQMTSCVASAIQNQNIELNGFTVTGNCNIHNISQEIIAKQVTKCLAANEAANKAIADMQSLLDNDLKSKSIGMDLGMVFIALIIFVFLGFMVLKGGSFVTNPTFLVFLALLIGALILYNFLKED
jgi:hypothetical protein